ncbi:response regulator [Sphingosinicella sp. CPCC 101087]|uniref:response regulator n=1 Tax=Sphingosinicella sp. CPCC 101087 TaxID=2497754 RepID=UPI001981AAF4|nr:response regulator [Sphingosinicella sp. CPCC 101087]
MEKQAGSGAASGARPGERARVLVVDDDDRNLLAIRTVIEDLADVEVASSGEEALRHLLKGEFAVILLDVYMPGLDGYETAQLIRQRDQTKRIPIVFLSAVNKEKEHLIRGYSMGAVDYVFKPVEPIVLRSKVAVFVDLYTMTREIQRKAEQEQRLLDENLRANTERLRVEKELRLAEQRQAAIIKSLPIILYLEPESVSPRVPQFVGGNFAAVTGFPFEAVEEQPTLWTERLHPDDRERALKAIEDRQQTGVMAIEYRWLCADGQYKHFLDQAVLLRDSDGKPAQYAGTLLDVTDRKDLERELLHARKMDAIGKLTGGIAHDFNNLLAAVLGGIGLIERRLPLADDQKKILAMTRRAAEQGSELVGRLLAFARRQQLQPADVDIAKLSGSVTDLLAHTLGGLVQLEWRSQEEVWCAYADSTQLELALMNLIINARDAMPEGGTITVEARNDQARSDNRLGLPVGDYVVIAVKDDGSGIPAEILEQVTEPFFTTKGVGEGTGLGLSMVYGFARQSDGAIDITSRLGEGTVVEIWLPRAPKRPRRSAQPAERPESSSEPVRSLRVLLVDDHEAVRETTAGMLCDLGHEVESMADGAAMLRRLKEAPAGFDLVVTDYAMPLMSGVELLKEARRVRTDLPAIIISGYADSRSIVHGPKEAVILTKPFTLDQMRTAIAAVVPDALAPHDPVASPPLAGTGR